MGVAVDGVLQSILLLFWLYLLIKYRKQHSIPFSIMNTD